MSNYRKVHITLVPESFQAIRRYAFDEELTISEAIDYLIQRCLIEKMLLEESSETAIPPEPVQLAEAPKASSDSRPTTWTAVSKLLK